MSLRIIVDSASDIQPSEAEAMNIKIIPIRIRFEGGKGKPDDREYLDQVDLSLDEFYTRLINEGMNPKTSQAPPFDYTEEFEAAKAAGDTVLCITISSGVSGTYQGVHLAAQGYEDIVTIVDSQHFCSSYGLLVKIACKMRDEGKTASEIADYLETAKKRVQIISVFDTLEYLKRGGRLSAGAAMIGGVLGLKLIVTIRDGKVAVLEKVRGQKKAQRAMNEFIQKCGVDTSMPMCFGYTGLSNDAIIKYIEDSGNIFGVDPHTIEITRVGATVGTYAGPDALAFSFFPLNAPAD